jgi:hypothetical protein
MVAWIRCFLAQDGNFEMAGYDTYLDMLNEESDVTEFGHLQL